MCGVRVRCMCGVHLVCVEFVDLNGLNVCLVFIVGLFDIHIGLMLKSCGAHVVFIWYLC